MFKYSSVVLASLIGAGAFALPVSSASAAALPAVHQNIAGDLASQTENLRVDVNHKHWKKWRGHNRHRYWRHRNRGFSHFGFYAAPLIIGGGYGYNHYGYGGSHGEWCANRYRSYNWRHNTWVSYSGRVYQCRSPYGYY